MGYLNLLWNLYQLKRNTSKTRAQIKSIQENKLRKLLNYAYENSKYYRTSFEKAGITKEQIKDTPISFFPIMDKSILLENFDDIVTEKDLKQEDLRKFDLEESIKNELFRNKYHVVHSSGSTGKPGYFIYDTKAWNQMLLGIIRAALWNMSMIQILKFLSKGLRIVYIAATDGRYGGAMAVSGGIEGVHAKQLFLDIKTPLSEWIEKIKEFNPNMVIGYPSAIKILGELMECGEIKIEVCRVISCGEPLNISLRQYLEKVFSADVINIYGASESLALGVETGNGENMYLFDDMNYIEVENGTMYLTSLYNYVQPLIRYKISDKLKLKEESKGRYPFTQAEILLGRNEDLIWFEDGKGNKDFLHPLAVEGFCIEGLLDYQFRRIEKDSFEMLAEASNKKFEENIKTEMFRQMKMILQEKHLEYIQFYIRFVEKIMPDPKTGKKPLIIK